MIKRRSFVAVVLAFTMAAAPMAVLAAKPDKPKVKVVNPPLVTVTNLVVNEVVRVGDQLVANATVTLDIVGRTITRDVQIPLTLEATDGAPGTCDILNLSLGPINLDLLGLIVNLDDCNGGPVTVDITGSTGPGNLLGNLLCGIAGLLDPDGLLNLDALTSGELATLTGGLTSILNGILNEFFTDAVSMPMAMAAQNDGDCPILDLMLGPINLNLLGLRVVTSPICLSVSAESGPGNLLGNLLCSLSNLLNNRGNNANAQQVLLRNILRVLDRLGL